MKNYMITFGYDGYKFKEVVQAENAEQAKTYLNWLDDMKTPIKAEETSEIADYYCPEGWTKPESVVQALARSYNAWLTAYVGRYMVNGMLVDSEELRAFLESEEWVRREEEDEEGFTDVVYTRGNKEIVI